MAKLVLKEHFHSGPSHSSLLRANGFWDYNRTEKRQTQEVSLVSVTQAEYISSLSVTHSNRDERNRAVLR